jgi:hypothetical protein
MNSKEPTFLFPAEPIRALNLIPQLCFVFLCVFFFCSSAADRRDCGIVLPRPTPPPTKVPAPFSIIQSLTSLKWTSGRSSVILKPFSLPQITLSALILFSLLFSYQSLPSFLLLITYLILLRHDLLSSSLPPSSHTTSNITSLSSLKPEGRKQ